MRLRETVVLALGLGFVLACWFGLAAMCEPQSTWLLVDVFGLDIEDCRK